MGSREELGRGFFIFEQPVRKSRRNDDNNSIVVQFISIDHTAISVLDDDRMLLELGEEQKKTTVHMKGSSKVGGDFVTRDLAAVVNMNVFLKYSSSAFFNSGICKIY